MEDKSAIQELHIIIIETKILSGHRCSRSNNQLEMSGFNLLYKHLAS